MIRFKEDEMWEGEIQACIRNRSRQLTSTPGSLPLNCRRNGIPSHLLEEEENNL